MKKKISLFLFALTLVATALVHRPAEAACFKPDCFASPPCCYNLECASWCRDIGGGAPYCEGVSSQYGGCCACAPVES